MIEYSFKSANQKNNIHCNAWEPKGDPVGAILIVHGMNEHAYRYREFAKEMARNGYYVAGHDHLGHGVSVESPEERGFFGEKKGNEYLLADIDTHVNLIKEKLPNTPLFMLGHSMGSFLARQYICRFGDKLKGAIISGTGYQPPVVIGFGKVVAIILSKLFGWHFRSKMIQQLSMGSYQRKIKNPRTLHDWLTRDTKIVDEFVADEKNSFLFTVNGYFMMFISILDSQDIKKIRNIPDSLPLFIISGDEDPVGSYGKGVLKIYNLYKSQGKNVDIKLYNGDRHEVLNELDRDVVYADLLDWLDKTR